MDYPFAILMTCLVIETACFYCFRSFISPLCSKSFKIHLFVALLFELTFERDYLNILNIKNTQVKLTT